MMWDTRKVGQFGGLNYQMGSQIFLVSSTLKMQEKIVKRSALGLPSPPKKLLFHGIFLCAA